MYRASEGTLSHWSRLHLQSLAPTPVSRRLTSGRRPVVKIIAEILSQHDEKHVGPTPLSGIRVGGRVCYLVGPSPVRAVVVQHAPPQHGHDLGEVFVSEGGQGQLLHLLPRRAPRLVRRRLAHLALHLRVVHHHICPGNRPQSVSASKESEF
jgi:hypothetical protein